MLRAMSFLTSVRSSVLLLAVASFVVTGCSKDKKDDAADAAAVDATVAVVDAAVVDAAVAVVDASVAPLATTTATVAVQATAKPKVDPPICTAARSAKQRKSPAAPGLERQCVAAGGTM
jgi:hypothetical protein